MERDAGCKDSEYATNKNILERCFAKDIFSRSRNVIKDVRLLDLNQIVEIKDCCLKGSGWIRCSIGEL